MHEKELHTLQSTEPRAPGVLSISPVGQNHTSNETHNFIGDPYQKGVYE